MAVVIVICIVAARCRETRVRGDYDTRSRAHVREVYLYILCAVCTVSLPGSCSVCTCVCSRNPNHCITNAIICQDPIPPASSNRFSSRLSGTCCYAEVDFERNPQTAIPPPPVEVVTYAIPVGEKEVSVCVYVDVQC